MVSDFSEVTATCTYTRLHIHFVAHYLLVTALLCLATGCGHLKSVTNLIDLYRAYIASSFMKMLKIYIMASVYTILILWCQTIIRYSIKTLLYLSVLFPRLNIYRITRDQLPVVCTSLSHAIAMLLSNGNIHYVSPFCLDGLSCYFLSHSHLSFSRMPRTRLIGVIVLERSPCCAQCSVLINGWQAISGVNLNKFWYAFCEQCDEANQLFR